MAQKTSKHPHTEQVPEAVLHIGSECLLQQPCAEGWGHAMQGQGMADYGRLSAGGHPPLDPSSGYGKGGISIQSMPMVYPQGSGSLGTSPGMPRLPPFTP